MKNIDNAISHADVLFIAKVAAPYQVSEETFTQIVAQLNAPNVDPEGRADAIDFFALACNMAAKVSPRAADVSSIYKAACECARRSGIHAFGDKQATKLVSLV